MSKIVVDFNTIHEEMRRIFKYTNIFQKPKILKIITSSCVSKDYDIKQVQSSIEQITCQKSVTSKAKKSIAQWSVREGMPIGVYNTITNSSSIVEYLKRIYLCILNDVTAKPIYIRSFNRTKTGVQLSIGIRDLSNFVGVRALGMAKKVGANITIVTNAKNIQEAAYFLYLCNLPIDIKEIAAIKEKQCQ